MFDWQTIAVVLIVSAATAFVGRRIWGRIAAFGGGKSGCETGCGKCAPTKTRSSFLFKRN